MYSTGVALHTDATVFLNVVGEIKLSDLQLLHE